MIKKNIVAEDTMAFDVVKTDTSTLDLLSKLINNEIYKHIFKLKRLANFELSYEMLLSYLKDLQMYNIYVLLQSQNLIKLTEKTFSNEIYSYFILSVSSALTLRTYIEEDKNIQVNYLRENVVNMLSTNSDYDNSSIVPNDIKNAMEFDSNTVNTLLENNNWLLWLIYIMFFFEEPNTFQ